MEYLTITGCLRLKNPANQVPLTPFIKRLNTLNFKNRGSAVIRIDNDILMIDLEGEIADEIGFEVIVLLQSLNQLITGDSLILINHIRWEMNVNLIYNKDDTRTLEPNISGFPGRQENNQLILI